MSNQAWDKTVLGVGNELDEHVLENLYERQVKKLCPNEARDDIFSARQLF